MKRRQGHGMLVVEKKCQISSTVREHMIQRGCGAARGTQNNAAHELVSSHVCKLAEKKGN